MLSYVQKPAGLITLQRRAYCCHLWRRLVVIATTTSGTYVERNLTLPLHIVQQSIDYWQFDHVLIPAPSWPGQ